MTFDAFFLEAPAGRRFCLHTRARAASRGALLYIHPFAEEMNRSRKMAALTARALAGAGFDILQIDLGGCGDSAGDFGDATWAGWIDDVEAGARWLGERGAGPLWLWSLRAGALLAAAAAARGVAAAGLLMLHPVLDGEQALRQFLRLKIGTALAAPRERASVDALRRELQEGKPVEVAGYTLGPALARGLAAADLSLPRSALAIECIEVTGGPDPAVSPALAERASAWRAAGHRVEVQAIEGPPFWQTAEVATSAAVTAAVVAAVTRS